MSTLAPPPVRQDGPAHRADAATRRGLGERSRQLFTGRPEDPRWARPTLWAILLLATALYAWNLSTVSGNSFYDAAVYSGTKSWKAFFFGALDSGSFITVDKPPFALWVMGISARIFGYGDWQLLLPMVAAGVGSVALLYRMVRRPFGHAAATIAALVLTLTPITVAINRDTNPDPILVLLMLLGAAGLMKAVRTGKLAPLVWSGIAIGCAFNTKMMQAYIVLPVFFAVYLFAANASLGRRLRHLAVGTVALLISSAWWMVIVDLIPASSRPYIGGSTDNTVWNLVLGYNGFGRIFGSSSSFGSAGNGASFGGTAGLGRLFNTIMGGQISWLIPFAAIALVGALVLRGRAPRTDLKRASLLLWGGWLVLHYLTFALAEGTFHPYYVTAMAPAIAALCGAGGVALYHAFRKRDGLTWAWVLPVAVVASAVWSIVLLERTSGWNGWLVPVIGLAAAVAVVSLLIVRFTERGRFAGLAVAAMVVALLAGPAAYSVAAATTTTNGTNPTAGPTASGGMGGGGMGGASSGQRPSGAPSGSTGSSSTGGPGGSGAPSGTSSTSGGSTSSTQSNSSTFSTTGQQGGGMGGSVSSAEISYLEKNQDGAQWLVAVATDQTAASIILESGQPVISMGGWSGSDNAMTLSTLKTLVKEGKLHYIIINSDSGQGTNSAIATWVKAHGTAVSSYSGLYRLDASAVG
jgi:4-amino-4-deoxy-L-arabinose transferase-like glycosyltransferase